MSDQNQGQEAAQADAGLLDAVRAKIGEGDYEAALDLCHQAGRVPETATDALTLIAVIAYHVKAYGRAASLLEQAYSRPDCSSDVPEILAVIYALSGQLDKALFYGKLSAVVEPDHRIRPALGDDFPDFATVFLNIQSEPLLQRGQSLLRQGAVSDAIDVLEQHLSMRPTDEAAMDAVTEAYLRAGQPAAAVDLLRGLRAKAPDNAEFASRLGRALTLVGALAEGDACHADACALAAPGDMAPAAMRLRDLAFHGAGAAASGAAAVAELGRAAREAVAQYGADDLPPPPAAGPTRVGFLCAGADPADLAVAVQALARRDAERIHTIGYGVGSLAATQNAPLRDAFDEWHDLAELDAFTVCAIVRGDGVHVLVDLAGLEGPFLPVLALRAAPVQVAWFGHVPGPAVPGVDLRLTGPGGDDAGAGAAPAWPLPVFPYLVAAPAGGDGEAAPQDGVTFAADATLAQINPALAAHWARILRQVPDSTLILRDHDFRRQRNTQRLIDLFGTFAVAHRIDVVAAESADHFFRQGDVALLPFPNASLASAAAALQAGVPVVALHQPETLACEAARLLAAHGLDSRLLAEDAAAYVQAAVAVGRDARLRAELRPDAVNGVTAAALAAALQDAFEAMAERVRA